MKIYQTCSKSTTLHEFNKFDIKLYSTFCKPVYSLLEYKAFSGISLHSIWYFQCPCAVSRKPKISVLQLKNFVFPDNVDILCHIKVNFR